MRLLLIAFIVLVMLIGWQVLRNDCRWYGSEFAVAYGECLTRL